MKREKADAQFQLADEKAYRKVLTKAKTKMRELISELTTLRQASERVELMGANGSGETKAVTNREVASEALRIQKDSKNITSQIISTIDETKEKLSEEVVTPVLDKLKQLESLIVSDDKPVSDDELDETSIQSRIQELEELMHALSSKLYEAAAAEVSEEEGDETEDSDVVEADFEVLDSDEDDNDE